MTWIKPQYSASSIDKAGQILIDPTVSSSVKSDALDILNNWRSSHSYPLNTFQMRLRRKAPGIDKDVLVAQRLKRIPSIITKLKRNPKMALSRMQDIGGCRAIVNTVDQVRLLYNDYEKARFEHKLVTAKDYIIEPKYSGYRGIHLVYLYRGKKYSDSKTFETYNKCRVEIQIRTRLQHAWATAVETVGLFLRESLKSSEGPDDWLTFFAYTSSVFAHIEGTQPLHKVLTERELLKIVSNMALELDVCNKLSDYHNTLKVFEEGQVEKAHYYLLTLQPGSLQITGFKESELAQASEQYLKNEKELIGAEVVLVSAESIEALRSAYPNYFLDTELFLDRIKIIISQS
ncbi:MAG: RelA/SpoT domain-containing protein [Deltaproteobacteria bacterium]|nr:RelA/SpoT domain-containing protein [Deltaproteobacteria bacterium]